MASHQDDAAPGETSHAPQECMPCRGTGRVISNLGGTVNKVTCPWCQGDGVRHFDVDAQAGWLHPEGGGGQAVEAPESSPPAAAEEAA
jgi:hypothetical protein